MRRGFLVRSLFFITALSVLTLCTPSMARAQQEHAAEPAQTAPADHSVGGELAKETREEMGEEEEHENLKHSSLVQKLAKATGLSVHQAHLAAVIFNFAVVVVVIYWFARKSVPVAMQRRNETIQRALEEARAASQDADRRLKDIESRLAHLDSEIAQMQATAQEEADGENARIKTAAEDDVRKIVASAEQEIASAAKQARRELMAHTADLAVALARKQIKVDPATDQALVRSFAGNLSSGDGGKERA